MNIRQQFSNLRPAGIFRLIMADPPWSCEMRSEAGDEKSPQAQYQTMRAAGIKAMPFASVRLSTLLPSPMPIAR